MFTSDDYFHITNARILNENVNHLDERRYEPDEKLPSGKTPFAKMKERENKLRRAATSQGGGSRGDAKNRSSKIGSIRGAIERGEDPRADGYGGARAARGNPPEDHRAAFSKNPLNKPPRRVKEPGVKKEEFDNLTEKNIHEPSEAEQFRQSDAIAQNPRVKAERAAAAAAAKKAAQAKLKSQGLKRKNGTSVFEEVVEYLFVEGYADTIKSAELIAENISASWVNEILDFSGRKERKDEKRKGVGGFSEAMSNRPEEPSQKISRFK